MECKYEHGNEKCKTCGVKFKDFKCCLEYTDKLYQIINQFTERKVAPVEFHGILLNETHTFYNGNGRTCKTLFANDDKN